MATSKDSTSFARVDEAPQRQAPLNSLVTLRKESRRGRGLADTKLNQIVRQLRVRAPAVFAVVRPTLAMEEVEETERERRPKGL